MPASKCQKILVTQQGQYVPSWISFAIRLRLALSSVNGLVSSRRFLTLSCWSVGAVPLFGTRRLGSVMLPDSLGVNGTVPLRLASSNMFRVLRAETVVVILVFHGVDGIFGVGVFLAYIG